MFELHESTRKEALKFLKSKTTNQPRFFFEIFESSLFSRSNDIHLYLHGLKLCLEILKIQNENQEAKKKINAMFLQTDPAMAAQFIEQIFENVCQFTQKQNLDENNVINTIDQHAQGVDSARKSFCRSCKSKNIIVYQRQTRGADEGATTFVQCLDCNHRGKK